MFRHLRSISVKNKYWRRRYRQTIVIIGVFLHVHFFSSRHCDRIQVRRECKRELQYRTILLGSIFKALRSRDENSPFNEWFAWIAKCATQCKCQTYWHANWVEHLEAFDEKMNGFRMRGTISADSPIECQVYAKFAGLSEISDLIRKNVIF